MAPQAGFSIINRGTTKIQEVVDLISSCNSMERWRLGVVSFLNAKPLIEGLDSDANLVLRHDVPARLPALLDRGEVDVALVPVVDLVKGGRRWQIVSDACIGCDGETLTVRVFSRVPPQQVRRLHVDGDSHTSVVLAAVVWQELFATPLDIIAFRGDETVEE
jgi:chorismate dehydratase